MNVTCLTCKKEFNKKPHQIKKSPNHFCSRSCSAKYNNVKFPKREKVIRYCSCGGKISRRNKFCADCRDVFNDDTKLGDIVYLKHGPESRYALVRSRARSVAKRLGWKFCAKCGYDKHIEIAHIKPVSSFSEDTPVKVINAENNLMALCPNCHWEFDNLK